MEEHLKHLEQLERQGSKLCRDVGPSIEDQQRLKDELERLAVAATSGPRESLRASEMDQMHAEPYNRQTDVPIAPEVKHMLTADGSSSSDELSDYGMDVIYVVRVLRALSLKSFANRWELLRIIGTGGSGVVVLAKDKKLKQNVALKAMKGAPIFGQGEQKRHEREAIAMKRVNHPCIVNFYEAHYDTSKRIYFMVMEHCPGRSLEAVLASDGPLPYRKLVEVAVSLIGGLQGE
jgi:serine/threonine protein kinase